MSEPAVETPETETSVQIVPPLRREAILPRERHGGLGAVALLCSLAGVASGFALATTILATQLAQSEGRIVRRMAIEPMPAPHAVLGLVYRMNVVEGVEANSPAAEIGVARGDVIISYDGEPIDQKGELGRLVRASPVGHEATLIVKRGAEQLTFRPTLTVGVVPLSRR